MVDTYIIRDIEEDKKGPIPEVTGKILKVAIKSNVQLFDTRVRIITNEYEEIVNHRLENVFNLYKPFYVNVFEQVSNEQRWVDYFYSDGPLGLEVTGLQEGEKIDFIKIFYEN